MIPWTAACQTSLSFLGTPKSGFKGWLDSLLARTLGQSLNFSKLHFPRWKAKGGDSDVTSCSADGTGNHPGLSLVLTGGQHVTRDAGHALGQERTPTPPPGRSQKPESPAMASVLTEYLEPAPLHTQWGLSPRQAAVRKQLGTLLPVKRPPSEQLSHVGSRRG